MPIKLGSTDIDDVRLGAKQIDKVYLGTTLIWRRGTLPVWRAIGNRSVGYNANVNLNLNDFVTGDPTPTITVSGLPSGVSASNGVISGKSTVTGTRTITVTATNLIGSAQTTFSLTVKAQVFPLVSVKRASNSHIIVDSTNTNLTSVVFRTGSSLSVTYVVIGGGAFSLRVNYVRGTSTYDDVADAIASHGSYLYASGDDTVLTSSRQFVLRAATTEIRSNELGGSL